MRTKPNFKTIDLAAPVWVPKVNEMCEAELAGFWVRCRVVSNLGGGRYEIEYESKRDGSLKKGIAATVGMREGTTPASKLDQGGCLKRTTKCSSETDYFLQFLEGDKVIAEFGTASSAKKQEPKYNRLREKWCAGLPIPELNLQIKKICEG